MITPAEKGGWTWVKETGPMVRVVSVRAEALKAGYRGGGEVDQKFRYTCHTCGATHEGLPSFAWDYPIDVLGVPKAERDRRVMLTKDTCIIDSRWYYIRVCLEIPIHDCSEHLGFGVWVSVSEKNYRLFCDLFHREGRESQEPFFAWLPSVPPGYPDAQLKAMVHLRPLPDRPWIELEPTDHPLAIDQREGIPAARAQQIAEKLLHPK
jgi:hypothetical protein